MAASTVSGLVRCGYISCVDKLKVSKHFGRGELFAEVNLAVIIATVGCTRCHMHMVAV